MSGKFGKPSGDSRRAFGHCRKTHRELSESLRVILGEYSDIVVKRILTTRGFRDFGTPEVDRYANGVPFLPVTVFVKLCLKTQCKAMHQVFLFDIGEYIIYYINFMYQFYFVRNYIYVNRIRSQRFLFVWLNSYFPFFKVCSTSAISSLCHWTFYWSSESPLKEEFPSQLLLRASLQFFY